MLRWVSWVVLVGCAGPAAKAIRPGDPTYAGAVGQRCAIGDAMPQPLVVDWRAEDRADLEVAMKRGVAVVAFDCERLRVLPDCTADGGYGFVAVTPKTQRLELTNKDEIKANLPAGVIAANATVERGAALDVSLSIVGKQMATVGMIDGARLRGQCAGATHFVRAVTTGAFTLATHTNAQVDGSLAAKGAGASTTGSSDRQIHSADGDPSACASVSPTSPAPPRGCSTPLRLDLVGIGAYGFAAAPGTTGDATVSATPADVYACPPGLAWRDGACRSAPQVGGACHSTNDVADCARRCEDNDWAACTNLGVSHLDGRYIELDRARALALFERACAGGEPNGCYNLGGMLLVGGNGIPADRKRGLALSIGACYADPKHCPNAAIAYRDGIGTQKNPARAVELFSRACLGGRFESCWDVSLAYENGRGVPADGIRASELELKACNGGFLHACASVSARHMFGKVLAKDDVRAVQYARLACERGRSPLGCSLVGYLTIYGRGGLRKDVRGGVEIMKSACESDPRRNTCEVLGETLRALGDEPGARSYLRRACEGGVSAACARIEPQR